jgi:threonine dehydrogenase-like Zn-dependent dehydrogenase
MERASRSSKDVESRQVMLEGPRHVTIVKQTLAAADDDNVIGRGHQASICGTDKTFYRGALPALSPLAHREFESDQGGDH